MNRYILSACIAMLALTITAQAQTPKYQFTAFSGTQSPSGGGGQEFKKQALYTKFNFPGMPAGRVKAVYFRVDAQYTIVQTPGMSCAYQQFTAKIGYTKDSSYKLATSDSFRTGLTTFYGPDTFSIPCSATGGTWIRIPVKKGNFVYDPERYFSVEIAAGPAAVATTGFPDIANSILSLGAKKTMYDYNRNATTTSNIASAAMDLGIDLGTPDEVAAWSNMVSFGLFPNPAPGGRFNVSLEAKQSIREATLSLSDALGRQVWAQRLEPAGGKAIFKEVNAAGVAPGVYVLRVEADGEVLNRRLVIQ